MEPNSYTRTYLRRKVCKEVSSIRCKMRIVNRSIEQSRIGARSHVNNTIYIGDRCGARVHSCSVSDVLLKVL